MYWSQGKVQGYYSQQECQDEGLDQQKLTNMMKERSSDFIFDHINDEDDDDDDCNGCDESHGSDELEELDGMDRQSGKEDSESGKEGCSSLTRHQLQYYKMLSMRTDRVNAVIYYDVSAGITPILYVLSVCVYSYEFEHHALHATRVHEGYPPTHAECGGYARS